MTLIVFILKVSYRLDNKKRDRLYGKPQRNTTVNTHELADKVCFFCNLDRLNEDSSYFKAPNYRYVP